jgi:hypothetical protein
MQAEFLAAMQTATGLQLLPQQSAIEWPAQAQYISPYTSSRRKPSSADKPPGTASPALAWQICCVYHHIMILEYNAQEDLP